MRLKDGDSVSGRFISPSGREIKSFSTEYLLPPENQLQVRFHGSLTVVAEVFAKFNEEKRDIVRSIKFDGVLDLARHETFDVYFYLWVLSRLDSSRCSIRVSGSEEIPIRDRDVGNVLGIPWYGEVMIVEETASYDTMRRIRKILCIGDQQPNISMGHIVNILDKEYDEPMSEAEVDAFKVATVLFSMTNILATGGSTSYIPLGLLRYLTDPSKIDMFNWGLLVRRYLVSWSHFLIQQLQKKETNITVGGCFLLPMIVYLDNALLGDKTIIDYEFPRSTGYSTEVLNEMILADSIGSNDPEVGRIFGKSKLKSADTVFYGRWLVEKQRRETCLPVKRKLHNSDKEKDINMKHQKEPIMYRMNDYIDAAKIPVKHIWDKFSEFYDELNKGIVSQLHRYWVCHLEPFEIKIRGSTLAAHMSESCPYHSQFVDAVLRNQVQHEDKMFGCNENRERHLMPSCFLEAYRKLEDKKRLDDVRMFFIGDHVKYKVVDCIQINMPVTIRRKWSCYSWNLVEKTLTILDPLMMKGSVLQIKQTHADMATELTSALMSCLEAFFPGWTNIDEGWTTIYRNDVSDKCSWSDTGLYSLHYAVTFNTDDITDEINWEDDFIGRKCSLWKILTMDGNIGERPVRFHKIENDEED